MAAANSHLKQPRGTTMTILRVGTNARYADGWSAAFGKAKPAKSAAKSTKKKAAAKKGKKKK